ncbi:hypothetical protein DLAC_09444 [Tieghemostelium lacteum]|uniref:Uncharacterized protein n=1 Tax=Tieghemostelium lacteum TaxID=361077 RepID=A0A151ZA57_TIELA|nr:hypothetical protein DLAC_09444 [Tieghemostelium lacteum]|eukprot:KYQ90803.1 hypothetical protein DLAC_09444 [Tieghemostelium lacteum]
MDTDKSGSKRKLNAEQDSKKKKSKITNTASTTTTTSTNINNNNNQKDQSKAIVAKHFPNQINISRKGKHYTLDTPKTFLGLKESVQDLQLTPTNREIFYSDLSGSNIEDEISYQKFLLNAQANVILVYLKGEQVLESPEAIVVDITPSKNILLKAGTSEYNFSNAIAEFIDNSIQAVRNNPYGNRNIDIYINKPNSTTNTTSIIIRDNGCGMTKDELQRWATMGLSQADLDPTQDPSLVTSEISGLISRFGVGGKKAAFYLGSEVTVNSKVSGCEYINEATISLDILSETGDQEWKIPIKVRKPTDQEQSHEQFTEVIINNVVIQCDTYDQQMGDLKRDLAHIYYYYLHEIPKIDSHYNLAEIETVEDDDDNNDNDNDLTSDDQHNSDEKNSSENTSDPESTQKQKKKENFKVIKI